MVLHYYIVTPRDQPPCIHVFVQDPPTLILILATRLALAYATSANVTQAENQSTSELRFVVSWSIFTYYVEKSELASP